MSLRPAAIAMVKGACTATRPGLSSSRLPRPSAGTATALAASTAGSPAGPGPKANTTELLTELPLNSSRDHALLVPLAKVAVGHTGDEVSGHLSRRGSFYILPACPSRVDKVRINLGGGVFF